VVAWTFPMRSESSGRLGMASANTYLWSPAEDKELRIVPVGEAIDFQQHLNIACRVVDGMDCSTCTHKA
jgi:hypothetical protein